MNGSIPVTPADTPSELDQLRKRVKALSRKRDEAEARLHELLKYLLPLDDLLSDTVRRAGALQQARSARETASAAVALSEQIGAAHLMLRGEFSRHDVSPMDVLGKVADPAEMRIVGTQPHPSAQEGTVLGEKVTGFRLGAALLRPAQVVVAVPGPAPEPEPSAEEAPDPAVPGPSAAAGHRRAQPRRTTRSERRLPRKPSAQRGRRPGRA